MAEQDEAWRRGLAALASEARSRYGGAFHDIDIAEQNELLRRLQAGELSSDAWGDMPGKEFFEHRVLLDIASAYYAHPEAWNAKQSALTVWIPRALKAGAEIRDLSMVARIETNEHGRVTGVHYHRSGGWHFHRARNVVVAGYAIETPRLLLASANARFPQGLANRSGLVGKNLMTQSNQAVFGRMERDIRWYKGPPSLTISEHWNYEDRKDFFGGYCWMAQGPLPIEWASIQTSSRGLWGEALRREMQHYTTIKLA